MIFDVPTEQLFFVFFFFEMLVLYNRELTHHVPHEGICVRRLHLQKLAKPVGVAPISYTGEATSRSQHAIKL